jgi:hypothetical protein
VGVAVILTRRAHACEFGFSGQTGDFLRKSSFLGKAMAAVLAAPAPQFKIGAIAARCFFARVNDALETALGLRRNEPFATDVGDLDGRRE